ncbi:MAG: hypothetical protein FJ290_09670 [Planctomycetes bacterium]|nr:hypothetical protein [Planctomycetota bacterium]
MCSADWQVVSLSVLLAALAGSAGCRVPSGPKPDCSKLTFREVSAGKDSFSLTLVAAARLLGRDADYETVFALSTNAFAPDLRPDEECRSSWMMRGRGQCLDLVAARLGLAVRPLGGFAARGSGHRVPVAEGLKRAAAAVRPALDRGEVVITDSGWLKGMFCSWGVILEATDDGTMRGATPEVPSGNSLDHACSFWALSPAKPTLGEHEADLEVLRRARARIGGDKEPFLPDSLACGLPAVGAPAVPGAVVWGLKAMDGWIAQMERPHFQEDDPGSSAGNARLCALFALEGAKAAASYLRKRSPAFPPPARPNLESAARHYERIAALLEPFALWEKGKGYRAGEGSSEALTGNPAKQKEHADKVLRRVKAELADAARALGDGLNAADVAPGQVRDDTLAALAAKEWTEEGVPYLGAGVPLAHVLALRKLGTPASFSDFAAASGWAFSFGYAYDGLRTASMAVCGDPKGDGPYEVFRWLTERLGYAYEGVPVRDEERFWAFVKGHVDAGRPILSEHLDGGLICGYREKAGTRQVWFDGPVGRGWLALKNIQPTWAYVLTRKGPALDRKQLCRDALRRAVQKASPHEWQGIPQGLAALEAYRADVADPKKAFDGGERGCWFCWGAFERLSARKCCAEWLKSAADVLGGDARVPLLAASGHYRKAFELYDRYRAAAGAGERSDLSLQARARTPERIAALLPLIDQAIAEERAGIEEMRKALAAAP